MPGFTCTLRLVCNPLELQLVFLTIEVHLQDSTKFELMKTTPFHLYRNYNETQGWNAKSRDHCIPPSPRIPPYQTYHEIVSSQEYLWVNNPMSMKPKWLRPTDELLDIFIVRIKLSCFQNSINLLHSVLSCTWTWCFKFLGRWHHSSASLWPIYFTFSAVWMYLLDLKMSGWWRQGCTLFAMFSVFVVAPLLGGNM